MPSEPAAAVVVATKDRPEDVVVVVRSILADPDPERCVVVVDQSEDDATTDALAGEIDDRRLLVLSTEEIGKGRALNRGVAATRSRYVLFTDDDCEVEPGWAGRMTRVFDEHPNAGAVFCRVVGGPHDPAAGFIPTYGVEQDHVWTSIRARRHRGLGAGMGVRRAVLDTIGGFDELLGPGSRFPSADDADLALRVLGAGHHVVDTAATEVVHHGFRSWTQGVALTRRDFVALGGMYGKALRLRPWSILPQFLVMVAWELGLSPFLTAARRRQRPVGLRRVVYFWEGVVDAFRVPLDRERGVFRADHTE